MTHHVVYCFDKNYEAHFGASVMSLILNYQGAGENLHIHLITEHNTPEFLEKVSRLRSIFRCAIEIIHPSSQQKALLTDLTLDSKAQNYLSAATWLRLLIPVALNDSIDRVLYLDADTIVQESVCKLLDSSTGQSPLCAVSDFSENNLKRHHNIDRYFNTGVMLLELKQWREKNHLAGCLNVAKNHADKLLFADQCTLNLYFSDSAQAMDPRWNQFIQSGQSHKTLPGGILHFLSRTKPWQQWFDHPLGEVYWHYRRISPWAQGKPQEARLLREFTQLARKLTKDGKPVQAQEAYEKIISALKKNLQ